MPHHLVCPCRSNFSQSPKKQPVVFIVVGAGSRKPGGMDAGRALKSVNAYSGIIRHQQAAHEPAVVQRFFARVGFKRLAILNAGGQTADPRDGFHDDAIRQRGLSKFFNLAGTGGSDVESQRRVVDSVLQPIAGIAS